MLPQARGSGPPGVVWDTLVNQRKSLRAVDGALYYNNTSALTPDGGIINGVGSLSQGKHLKAGLLS